MSNDITQRFLFEHLDIRGELVDLTDSYITVTNNYDYPHQVATLLGELLCANALLCSSLKIEGTLILQARSEGSVSLIMSECDTQQHIRGIAHYDENQPINTPHLNELMPKGILALTVDPKEGKRYQGVVSLEKQTLSECLADYFESSEQLPSFFLLHADKNKARGLFLQALPAEKHLDDEDRLSHWQHIITLASSLTAEELLTLDNKMILHRLYHQEDIRLFQEEPISFHCTCSKERSANALISLGKEDALQLLAERNGSIEINCQFCNQQYLFDEGDIIQLFTNYTIEPPSTTLQ